jgi:hypothetical protein
MNQASMSSGGTTLEESFKGNTNYGSNAAIGGAGLAAMSSSGNNQRCPIDDTSFMCQLSRTVSITSMVIYLLVVFGILIFFLYMLYKYMKAKK